MDSELEVQLRCRPVLSTPGVPVADDIGQLRAQAAEELRAATERLVKVNESLAKHKQWQEDGVPASKLDALALVTQTACARQPDVRSELQNKICEAVRSFWADVDAVETPAPDCPGAHGARNDEGAAVRPGLETGYSHKYYCGRRMEIPGSDGYCGPSNGPQCSS